MTRAIAIKTYKCDHCAFEQTYTGRLTNWTKVHNCEHHPRMWGESVSRYGKAGDEMSTWKEFESKSAVSQLYQAACRARAMMWGDYCPDVVETQTAPMVNSNRASEIHELYLGPGHGYLQGPSAYIEIGEEI